MQHELILPRGLSPVVRQFINISISVRAALQSTSSYNRLISLNRALSETTELRRILVFTNRSLSITFAIIAEQWYVLISGEITRISEKNNLWLEIPDPYIIGNPIFPTSHQVFVGRDNIFETIHANLEKPFQKSTFMLQGDRRSGKTSILLQLPLHLDTKFIPVFVDLQGIANVNSETSFLYSLAKSIARGAINTRNFVLPEPVRIEYEFDPFLAFNEWLNQVEIKLGEHLIILCLDEFEKLAEQISTERFSTNLLDLLRNLIQFHTNIVLIMSGLHINNYWQGEWASYFINVVQVQVDVLKVTEARQLITNPIPDFPLDYDVPVVEYVLQCTNCHPFLVQLTCHEIVKYQNQLQSNKVSIESAQRSVHSALMSGDFYFRDRWNNLTNFEQDILLSIAKGQFNTSHETGQSTGDDTIAQNAIGKLLQQKILRKDSNQTLMISLEMFKQWIILSY